MEKRKEVEVKVENNSGEEQVVSIYVIKPTNFIIKNADRYKAKIWNQCLLDDILTKKELEKILEKRGIWNKEKEDEYQSILNEIQLLEKQLYIGDGQKKDMSIEDGKNIALKMRRLRIKLRDLISERISMEENTAESLADNARFDYLVSECAFHKSGEKVYKGIDDYNSKSSDELAFAAANALAILLYQLDTGFEDSLPENKWLKTFNLINDDLSLIDENGNLVDINGKRINEDGHYINDNGERVDRDGNLLEEDGTYVIRLNYEKKSNTKSRKKAVNNT